MKSRLTNKNAKVNTKKNDVLPVRGREVNWNEMNFKLEIGSEPESAPEGVTGADIFSKENYKKSK